MWGAGAVRGIMPRAGCSGLPGVSSAVGPPLPLGSPGVGWEGVRQVEIVPQLDVVLEEVDDHPAGEVPRLLDAADAGGAGGVLALVVDPVEVEVDDRNRQERERLQGTVGRPDAWNKATDGRLAPNADELVGVAPHVDGPLVVEAHLHPRDVRDGQRRLGGHEAFIGLGRRLLPDHGLAVDGLRRLEGLDLGREAGGGEGDGGEGDANEVSQGRFLQMPEWAVELH